MSRKDPRTTKQIKEVNAALVALCEKYDMEFGVLFTQGEGPLEMFHCVKSRSWLPITQGIIRVVKAFSDEMRRLMASRN